ncbi:hypothetical protein DFP72DRAFT_1175562 [Ephemerocybe angulata]|uniref:Uncharacterized protein n=1 Tax=Ephemerocybe angulata TaxID=980116 RepID=A0A8H6LZA1_9AGAR|nr:hypothetical protein DFP72DRAFT_1175562 [Tulosesus angulatus]
MRRSMGWWGRRLRQGLRCRGVSRRRSSEGVEVRFLSYAYGVLTDRCSGCRRDGTLTPDVPTTSLLEPYTHPPADPPSVAHDVIPTRCSILRLSGRFTIAPGPPYTYRTGKRVSLLNSPCHPDRTSLTPGLDTTHCLPHHTVSRHVPALWVARRTSYSRRPGTLARLRLPRAPSPQPRRVAPRSSVPTLPSIPSRETRMSLSLA